jgi:hypothetical protein
MIKFLIGHIICAVLLASCYDFSIPTPDSGLDTGVNAIGSPDGEYIGANSGDCPGGLPCDNACVPNDAKNCGTCGHDCTALAHVTGPVSCVDGACVLTTLSCQSGWADCSTISEDGCETDITRPNNCGGCGTDCSHAAAPLCAPKGGASASQSAFECVSTCPAQAPNNCDNSCVDTATSPNNCGKCGIRCNESDRGQATCNAGSCGTVCNDGYHECAEKCVSNTSPDSCGDSCKPCEVSPNSTPSCDGSKCGFNCKKGYLFCNDDCVPSDEKNCGGCGHDCTGLKNVSGAVSCKEGVCSIPPSSCEPGFADCNKKPDDGCETKLSSEDNCGSCGTKCAVSAPVCSPKVGSTAAKPTFECGTGCTSADAPNLCEKSCVNTKNNASHCGKCNNACDSVEFGQPACANSKCTTKCNSGYHLCDGACVSNKSTNTCGTQECSTPCPKPENAKATCDGTKCDFSCNSSSYIKCSNGCFPKDDDKHCGTCEKDCTKNDQICDGAGNCADCLNDSDCTSSGARYCVEKSCKACNPNKTNTCGVCKKCSAQGSCSNFEDNTQDSAGCNSTCQACQSGKCSNAKNGTDPGNKCTKRTEPPCTGDTCDNSGACSTAIATKCYRDSEPDGYGDNSVSATYCGSCPGGWETNNTDCDDTNEDVYKGQKDYFPSAITGTNYDYDCSGKNDKQYTYKNANACDNSGGSSCTVSGDCKTTTYAVTVPDCGGTVRYGECGCTMGQCSNTTMVLTQGCK